MCLEWLEHHSKHISVKLYGKMLFNYTCTNSLLLKQHCSHFVTPKLQLNLFFIEVLFLNQSSSVTTTWWGTNRLLCSGSTREINPHCTLREAVCDAVEPLQLNRVSWQKEGNKRHQRNSHVYNNNKHSKESFTYFNSP